MDSLKPTLLFIDVTAPRAYDPACSDGPGIGGTEQTMVCLAEGLAETGLFDVVVEQHNRKEDYAGKALYTSLGTTKSAKWVVALRDPRPMVDARKRFPYSKIYLYSHDLADRNLGLCFNAGFFRYCVTNICVSQWHRTQTIETLKAFGYTGQFKIKAIYNPLSADVVRTGEDYDKNKLLWLASPHKGIEKAYEIFRVLSVLNPDFRLYVANPGYLEDSSGRDKGVINLGTIPHKDVVQHLRSSLCLFYPNTVFPETFGKVIAEANAVGTPVLTHPLGAAPEVIDTHPDQLVNCRKTEEVTQRVMKWYGGARPIVRGKAAFKLSNVIKEWVRLLDDIR